MPHLNLNDTKAKIAVEQSLNGTGGGYGNYSSPPPQQQQQTQQPPQYGERTYQAQQQQHLSFSTTFASMSLHMGDTMRMLAFPREAIDAIRQIINATWAGGVQKEREYYGSHEFKLKGYPWMSHGREAVTSRQLMNRFLAALFAQGWVLNLSTDASKSVSDADTLLFRHQNPAPAPCEWMAISFSNSDNIRFMRDAQQRDGVVDAFISLLGNSIQRHNPHEKVQGCYEIKLRGNPWRATGGETMYARSLLLQLLTTLEQHGWTVYASVDQKYQSSGSNNSSATGDTDTWHVCRQAGWTPGMPVYHN